MFPEKKVPTKKPKIKSKIGSGNPLS